MEADFSGWATKNKTKCTDGRTIMPDAFKHQDTLEVPLVYQHCHKDPTNVLGHVQLTNKDEGVWAEAFFNNTPNAQHMAEAVRNKDIKMMSIWANNILEKAKTVYHGTIREVSLVLSGANPGALIENVKIVHSDEPGDFTELDDEITIVTGEEIIVGHSSEDEDKTGEEEEDKTGEEDKSIEHADDATLQSIYDSMNDDQKEFLHLMVGEAINSDDAPAKPPVKQDNLDDDDKDDPTKAKDDEMTGTVKHHNLFEDSKKSGADDDKSEVISHDDLMHIVEDAKIGGSLKRAAKGHALAHGIEDIDILFPDAKAVTDTPELFARRVEWVGELLNGVTKRPFARIKSVSADITVEEARAKGYIKGHLKKEEFFKVAKRVTTPTTIYKKQKLDRDDIIDITDYDIVLWLKGEMRLMLDEEIARAILVGDGREADDEDKVDEERIRPIATDHELYTTVLNVNLADGSSTISEVTDAVVLNRSELRGSGSPTFFTTEYYIARWLLLKDTTGRKIYGSLSEVAAEMRVSKITPVEVLQETAYDDIIGIIVNPNDYSTGTDRGGAVSLFDDFDIDYNQYKYLIETRLAGTLTKLKSAMVVMSVTGTLTVPAMPAFDEETGEITITNQTGVVYKNADTDAVMNNAGSPYTVPEGGEIVVVATPSSSSYYFATSNDDSWTFSFEG